MTAKCTNHRTCLNELACPAFYVWKDRVHIDPDLCTGCALCAQVCPENAILPVRDTDINDPDRPPTGRPDDQGHRWTPNDS